MTSDHRVAGSSPAGCTPQHQPLMGKPLHHMGNMLGHFLDTFQNRFLSHEPRYLPSESRAFGNTRPGKYRGSSSPNSVTQSGDPELRTQTRSRSFAMFAHCLHVSSLQTGAFPYDVKDQTANDERPRFLPFRESERSRHPLHDDQLP